MKIRALYTVMIIATSLTVAVGARFVTQGKATESCCSKEPASSSTQGQATTDVATSGISGASAALPVEGAGPRSINSADLKLLSDYPSLAEKKFWIKAVKPIWLRPPCCGACSVLKQKDFKTLAQVLKRDSVDSTKSREIWSDFKTMLIASLKRQDPDMYADYVKLRKTELKQVAI